MGVGGVEGRGGLILLALVLLAWPGSARAAILYVDAAGAKGGDGSSWINAMDSLQDALADAEAGDEIRVAGGTYKPADDGDRAATFLVPDGVMIRGGFAGPLHADPDRVDPELFPTILSGDLSGDDSDDSASLDDNSHHVVTMDAAGAQTIVRDVIIEAGNATDEADLREGGGVLCINGASPTLEACVLRRNRADWTGGAIAAGDGSPTLIACALEDNSTAWVGTAGGAASVHNAEMIGCIFARNHTAPPFNVGLGGAVRSTGNLTLLGCAFHENGAGNGGALWCSGDTSIRSCSFSHNYGEEAGAIEHHAGSLTVVSTVFLENFGDFCSGGAIWNAGGTAMLVSCRFYGNAGQQCGGAVASVAPLTAVNCLFSGNHTGPGGKGGAVHNAGPCTLINCTFSLNLAIDTGGALYNKSGAAELLNCILWDNRKMIAPGIEAPDQIDIGGGVVMPVSSIIQNWRGMGQDTFSADPLFVDADGPDDVRGTLDDNLHIAADSPARDQGNSDLLPADVVDLDGDGDDGEALPHDLDGGRRIVGASVDIGVYEFRIGCAADLAPRGGDGAVGPFDLAHLLLQWGPCSSPCDADIAPVGWPDGMVGPGDLSHLLSNWGQCRR